MVILSLWQSNITPPRQDGPTWVLGAGGRYCLSIFRETLLSRPVSLLRTLLYSAAAARKQDPVAEQHH